MSARSRFPGRPEAPEASAEGREPEVTLPLSILERLTSALEKATAASEPREVDRGRHAPTPSEEQHEAEHDRRIFLRTQADLKAQMADPRTRIRVMLPWSEDDEEAYRTRQPIRYNKFETVIVNNVPWIVERGVADDVPLTVAEIMVDSRWVPPNVLPEGNLVRVEAEKRRAEERVRISKTEKYNRLLAEQRAI